VKAPRRDRGALLYLALMALCGAGSIASGRFNALGLVVVLGCVAGVVVLLALLGHEDPEP